MWISFIILALLIIASFIVGSICEKTMYHPGFNTKEKEFDFLRSWGYDPETFFNSVEHQKFDVHSPNGYVIKAEIIPKKDGADFADGKERIVVLSHGRSARCYTMMSFAEIYNSLGFTVVTYDQRFHGESGGESCSMGYHEAEDLVFIANIIKEKFPNSILGIHGESMGAASVMMAAPRIEFLDFAVEDCGYATLRKEFADSLKGYKNLPAFPFAPIGIMFSNMRQDFKVDDVRPIDAVAKTKIPMLFIHGGKDIKVPTENVYKLYDVKSEPKKLVIFEDVPHAKSSLMHHEEYKKEIEVFLKENGFI